MTTTIAPFEDVAGWERALYAFLAEKERRSGSRRTVEGYSRMFQHFFGVLGKPPDQVTSQGVLVLGGSGSRSDGHSPDKLGQPLGATGGVSYDSVPGPARRRG